MTKIRIGKEEKTFIKAYVKFQMKKCGSLDLNDSGWIEYALSGSDMLDKRNTDYRNMLEDYVISLILDYKERII